MPKWMCVWVEIVWEGKKMCGKCVGNVVSLEIENHQTSHEVHA